MSRSIQFRLLFAALALSLTLVILSIAYPGVENDEALFASGIFAPHSQAQAVTLFGRPVAIMLMDYLGAMKSWVYTPIFAIWGASVYSLRLPVLLLGCLSVWLFYRFLVRASGKTAAVIGAALLGTDVTFLLTCTFDWGPVALQHTLFLAGLLLVARFYQTRSTASLAAGFLCFGGGLWDKALFAWMLSGAGVGCILLYHKEIRAVFTLRRLVVAGLSFLLGAAPLIGYNLANDFRTFRGKHYSFVELRQDFQGLERTLDGSVLSGFLTDTNAAPARPRNAGVIEGASLWLADHLGYPSTNMLPHALALAMFLLPFVWRSAPRRLLLFFLIGFAVAWFQMVVTEGAGASAHHAILLWPYVIGIIAVSFSAATRRFRRSGSIAVSVVVLIAVVANLALANTYLASLIRQGPGPMWSDAIYPLVSYLKRARPSKIFAADWGMGDSIRLFVGREIPVGNGIETFFRKQLDDTESERVRRRLAFPRGVFVSYTRGREFFPDAKHLIQVCANANHYRRESLAFIQDRRGRDVFEVYRYVSAPAK